MHAAQTDYCRIQRMPQRALSCPFLFAIIAPEVSMIWPNAGVPDLGIDTAVNP